MEAGLSLWNREEYLYNKTPLDAVGTAQTVMTIKLASGTHVAVHEAALIDYAGMNLRREQGNVFIASLTPGSAAPKVSRACGLLDALAHPGDRRRCGRSLLCQPDDAQPQRAEQAGRRFLDQAGQVRRRLVEHDHRQMDLVARPPGTAPPPPM